MTLNLTVLSRDWIYVCADHRLSANGLLLSDSSCKVVQFQSASTGLSGAITYTGVGRLGNRDMADYVEDWLCASRPRTFSELATILKSSAEALFAKLYRTNNSIYAHTFVVAGFDGEGKARLSVVSNFEDSQNRYWSPVSSFTVSHRHEHKSVQVIVTGQKSAIKPPDRRSIEAFCKAKKTTPHAIRLRLHNEILAAARRKRFAVYISESSTVFSLSCDGSGVTLPSQSANVDVRQVLLDQGTSVGKLLSSLCLPSSGFVQAASVRVGGRPTCQPTLGCSLNTIEAEGYTLEEVKISTLKRPRATDINDSGAVVGVGVLMSGNALVPWTWSPGTEPLVFEDLPLADGRVRLDGLGTIFGSYVVSPEHAAAFRLTGQNLEYLASSKDGCDSGAVGASADGSGLLGWKSRMQRNAGQLGFQPFILAGDDDPRVYNIDCGWGMTLQRSAVGEGLVVAYVDGVPAVGLINRASELEFLVAGGVVPTCFNASRMILGIRHDPGTSTFSPLVSHDGRDWRAYALPENFEPHAVSDTGLIFGRKREDGYDVPYRSDLENLIKLPRFRDHNMVPAAINSHGYAVGTAESDHGSHAVIWIPN